MKKGLGEGTRLGLYSIVEVLKKNNLIIEKLNLGVSFYTNKKN